MFVDIFKQIWLFYYYYYYYYYYSSLFLIMKFTCDVWSCFSQVFLRQILNITCQKHVILFYLLRFHFNIFYILSEGFKQIFP
jgi:hypothetical protein